MRSIMLIIALVALPAAAWGFHSRDGHMAQAGNFHVELFVRDDSLTLYFWDRAERPIDASMVRALVRVRSGGNEALLHAVPVGESLQGHTPFSIGKDAAISVLFTVQNEPEQQADFAPGDASAKGHKH